MSDKIYSVGTNANGIFRFKTTITQAQYRACKTTPIILIPAPGSGKTVNLIGQVAIGCSGVGGFDFGAGQVVIGWDSVNYHYDISIIAPLASSSVIAWASGLEDGGNASDSVSNTDLKLACFGGQDSPTGTGNVTITFLYSILDAS